MVSAPSDNGRCSAFASSHGARIHTSRSSFVAKITGLPSDESAHDRVGRRGQEAVDLMRPRDRLRFGAAVAVERGPDASEGERD